MTVMLWSHIIFLSIAAAITVFVGRTLFKSGRIFLLQIFDGNAVTADAINRLLLSGYYLVNLACAALSLKLGTHADTLIELIERLSTNIGALMVLLGSMHFLNVVVLLAVRDRRARSIAREPLEITEFLD